MRKLTFARALVVAAAVVAMAAPTAAAAQDEPAYPDLEALDLWWDVMEHVVEELAYFGLVDRVDAPVPDIVAQIPGVLLVGEAPPSVYEAHLHHLEQTEGPELLARVAAADALTSDRVVAVLQDSGSTPVDAEFYLAAYDDVLWQWWHAGGRDWGLTAAKLQDLRVPGWWDDDGLAPVLAPIDPADLVATPQTDIADRPIESEAGAEVPPSQPSETPEPEAPQPGPSEPDTIPRDATGEVVTTPAPNGSVSNDAIEPEAEAGAGWYGPAALGGGLFVVIMLALLVVRRARRTPTSPDRADLLIEAGRRFLAATSIDELGTEIVESVRRVSGAGGARFMIDGAAWDSGSPPSFPDHVIEQVRATGRAVVVDEASLTAVTSNGQVVGVIGVTAAARGAEVVEQLAPLAGQGLANLQSRAATDQLAFVDALTDVPNRRRFDLDLSHHTRRAAGEGVPVAVAMIDVDHFKTYNDTNGHQEGDEALRAVAQLIGRSLRAEDTVYRFGGEEFVVLLPGADVDAAYGVAERIRDTIEAHEFVGGPTQPGGRVTVSIGVSTSPPPDGRVMLEAADAALYRAKGQGRNQVVLAR